MECTLYSLAAGLAANVALLIALALALAGVVGAAVRAASEVPTSTEKSPPGIPEGDWASRPAANDPDFGSTVDRTLPDALSASLAASDPGRQGHAMDAPTASVSSRKRCLPCERLRALFFTLPLIRK